MLVLRRIVEPSFVVSLQYSFRPAGLNLSLFGSEWDLGFLWSVFGKAWCACLRSAVSSRSG
jgi:hypothetical protein